MQVRPLDNTDTTGVKGLKRNMTSYCTDDVCGRTQQAKHKHRGGPHLATGGLFDPGTATRLIKPASDNLLM